MLYKEIIAVCSEIHTKHKYSVWEVGMFLTIKPGGTHSSHWALRGSQ